MQGLAEAITKIEQLVKAGTAVEFKRVDGDPLGRYAVIKADGTYEILTPPPGYHRERIGTVDDLAKFAVEQVVVDNDAVAYVTPEGVTLIYDQEDQRHRSTLRFTQTAAYAWICAAAQGITYTQREVIRLLRVQLGGCLPSESNLLSLVRNVKWTGNGETASSIQHGNESVGKSIQAKVQGEGAFPETFIVSTALFEEFGAVERFEVYIEPQPAEQSFYIRPLPKSVTDARIGTLEKIVQRFPAGEVAAYMGNPDGK